MTTCSRTAVATADIERPELVVRVGKTVAALGLNAAVNTLGQLSIVPVALFRWGETRYGEWVLLTGLVSVLKLTDLGLQTFVVNRMCASYARGDQAELQSTLHSALRIQLPLLSGILLLLGAAATLTPVNQLLGLRTVARHEFLAVALILASEFLISVPMGIVGGLYRATGHFPRAAIVATCQQLAVVTVTFALLAGGAGFVTLAAARMMLTILGAAWVIHDLRRIHPWLRLWPDTGAWRDGIRMVKPGLFFLLIPVADYLSGQITLLVVQRVLDGAEVSRLATHRTAVSLAQVVSNLLISAAWPELTTLHARAEHIELAKTQRSLAKVNVWLVVAVVSGLLPIIPLIYPSWTAGRLAIEPWTLTFLIIRTLVWATWSVSFNLLLAINRHERAALVLMGTAMLTNILAMVLVPMMGISGAAIAALVGDCCVSAWLMPWLASKEVGDDPVRFLKEVSVVPLLGLGIPIGLNIGAWCLFPSPVLRYGFVAPVSVLLAIVFVHRQLAPHERRIVNDLYRHLCRIRTTTLSLRGAP